MALSETFDVFFSYNSKDREIVRPIADEMRRQGVRVWMDEEILPLGQPWQPHVEDALKKVRAAAILLGPSGFGDWQNEEARLCLTQGVKRRIPVIAVLLPGGPAPEALPGYEAALFVRVESPEALQAGLAGLSRLGLPGFVTVPSRAQEEDVAAVLAWFREHDRWLLILDNVDTDEAAEAVRKILPQLQGKHVLITSRLRNWPAGIRKQPLDELSVEEATAFLLQRTEDERASSKDDPLQARQLAEILDGLPLALEQAAAYIARHQMTFSKYLVIPGRKRRGKSSTGATKSRWSIPPPSPPLG